MKRARHAYRGAVREWLNGVKGVETRIAESRSIPGEKLGFVVTYTTPRHGKVLLYVYVASKYRSQVRHDNRTPIVMVKRGVASSLLAAAGFVPGEHYAHAFQTEYWRDVKMTSKRWRAGVYEPKPAKYTDSNFIVPEEK